MERVRAAMVAIKSCVTLDMLDILDGCTLVGSGPGGRVEGETHDGTDDS